MKKFGFFDSDRDAESISKALLLKLQSATPCPLEEHIIAYLEAGKQAFYVPGSSVDLLSDSNTEIANAHVYTDGQWVWTGDVVYYVKKYHIALPQEFVAAMKINNWQCPNVNLAEIEFGKL